MELEHPLNKENFWNEQMEKFPKSMKIFCAWIDEYKKAVDWGNLFNEHLNIKFHDIPYEMQQGIWIAFVKDIENDFFEQCEWQYGFDLEESIKEVFGEIEPLIDDED